MDPDWETPFMNGGGQEAMNTFRVVIIEHGYATSRYEQAIVTRSGGEFIDASDRPLPEALKLCEAAEGILLRRIEVDREMIGRFKRCKIIARYGVGTDNIDVQAATEAGMMVGHAPVYGTDEVSSHAIALLLSCARDIVGTHQRMETGDWDVQRRIPLLRIRGRTLGIVGLGNIGSAVAQKMSGWGLRVLASDPFVGKRYARRMGATLVSLETLCRESDYISLHCPLLPETRHLIDRRTLDLMKPGAILVNTSRGPVVHTEDLCHALDRGQPAKAGLDVFETEPLPQNSPLRHHPAVILSDHVAWYSEESQVQLQTSIATDVARVCRGGLPSSLANPEVLFPLGRFDEWDPPSNITWQLKRLKILSRGAGTGRRAKKSNPSP
jgi:D-3-phosphoglycerate dehydrogenase / 2-oxoglutarate reductase